MNGEIFERASVLPQTEGVFNLVDSANRNLFAGVAENIRAEVKKITANDFLNAQTAKIEVFETDDNRLIKLFRRIISLKKPLYNFSLAEQNLYPHFKITREKFPRALVTRRIAEDDAEYFGAFLPETGVRLMLGFVNRMFRTRGCDLPIDGGFLVPCPEFYRKRCVAPCVENLCDEKKYLETVNFARLFLRNDQERLNEIISGKIDASADALDFEAAAARRDFSRTIADFLTDKDRNCRLDEATDFYEMKQAGAQFLVRLVTQRKRKTLGSRTFVFENKINLPVKQILSQVLWQFYAFHAPQEIFVPIDFPGRKLLEKTLEERGAKQFKINVLKDNNRKITVKRALRLTEFEFGLEKLKPRLPLDELLREFQKEFGLSRVPRRIEAFDVAHISGTDFTGAQSVWETGKFVAEDYRFWFFDEKSELETLTKTIEKRFSSGENFPDLILIDGGKAQLRAAAKCLAGRQIPIISAVKPPRKHQEISRFLFEDGESKMFDKNSNAAQILLKLRDEAHALANYVHRTKRETAHFYEFFQTLPGLKQRERQSLLRHYGSLVKIKDAPENDLIELLGAEKGKFIYKSLREKRENIEPFIVPVRFDEPNGDAADLRPLNLPEKLYRKPF